MLRTASKSTFLHDVANGLGASFETTEKAISGSMTPSSMWLVYLRAEERVWLGRKTFRKTGNSSEGLAEKG